MFKGKKSLAMAVFCAVASVGFVANVHAEELDSYKMDNVVIQGEKDALPGGLAKSVANVGLVGTGDVMETPYTVVNISEKTIKTFSDPHTGIMGALAMNPSVRSDRGGTYTDLTIRGFYLSGHNMYVNGIPGLLCQSNVSYDFADSVSIIAGPNLGVNGSTLNESVGGSVNVISKKATAEGNANMKFAYRGGTSFEQSLDVGKRFGKDNEWGIRVNAQNIGGETVIEGENLEKQNIFINLDHEDEKSKTNLLLGYNHVNHEGGPGAFSFDSAVTDLPDAPASDKLYKPDWSYNEYDDWIAALNHEQKLNENLTAFINAGYHREDWYGYIDGNPKIINNKGDFTISMTNYPLALTKKYAGIGLKGNFKIGAVKNDFVIGADKNWMNYWLENNPNWSWKNQTGNIYQDNKWPNPGIATWNPAHTNDTYMTGWHIVDTMKMLDDKLQLTLGLHGHDAKRVASGKPDQESDAICPTYAINYRVNDDVMVYAGHTESFGMGSMVSTNNDYANGGQMLDPAKSKQNEIGVRFKTGNVLNNISYFDITQENTIDSWENGKKYLRMDGEQNNKGFEWSFNGNIAEKWDVMGGIMYLDAKMKKTSKAELNGKTVNGAAEWSGVLGAIYHADDKTSLIGRVNYVDSTTINNGTLEVPSTVTFDLGASYKTKLSNTPVTFDLMCYNVAGKDYWKARSGSSSLSLGAPRTITLSATFDI